MSACLICGDDVDISQDLCLECTIATFKADHLSSPKPLLARSILGMERQRREQTDPDVVAGIDARLAELKRESEA